MAGLAALFLAALACLNNNPYKAGEGGAASLKALAHNISLNGTKHADGFCDPVDFCSACHGANLQGGTSGEPACTKCHGALWTNPNCGKLLHTVNLGGHLHVPNYCQPYANCAGCHGADLRGGTKGQPSCYTCHGDLWSSPTCGQNPHTVNLGGVLHAPNYCNPVQNCVGCHGADLRGGKNGEPSCYSCHADLWNNADCGQNTHTVNLGGVFHAPNYCRPYQNCTSCHGSSLHGGTNGAPSCLQCHDQGAWFNCSGHTHSMDGHLHATGYCQPLSNCVFCHGDQLQGGPNNEPKCTQCHGQLWTSGDCGGAKRIKR